MKSAAARKRPTQPADDVEAASAEVDRAAADVTDLEQRLTKAQAAVDGFAPARAQHSFAASQGDADAQSALNLLATVEAAARHKASDLDQALKEARRRLEAARSIETVADDQAGLEC